MLGKIAIFRGKSFEKSFFQIPRKIPFRGKKSTKNWPLVTLIIFVFKAGLPDFSIYMVPKQEKMYQMNTG
jgi:hypothetical protein